MKMIRITEKMLVVKTEQDNPIGKPLNRTQYVQLPEEGYIWISENMIKTVIPLKNTFSSKNGNEITSCLLCTETSEGAYNTFHMKGNADDLVEDFELERVIIS